MNSNPRLWRWFFILAALEAGAAFVALLAIPRSSAGFSLVRLGMLLVLGLCCLAGVFFARRSGPRGRLRPSLRHAVGAAGLSIATAASLFLLRYLEPERLLPYYERLSPLLWYALWLTGEFAIFCLIAIYGAHPAALAGEHRMWRASAITLLVLLLGFAFIAFTRIGLTPDSAYWGEPGVPILAWQLGAVVLCGACFFLADLKWEPKWRSDWAMALGIWLLAVLIWLNVPVGVMKNSFYAPITPPSYQPFPNSDAGYYDSMAQSLLIGYPYQGDIPTRPLYIVLLSLFHLAAGQQYKLIIFGQTLVLASIPVLLYFLGRRLHSRTAGLLAALFAIFREWNSLLISSQTRVSNTKTLLVDLPTLLLMLLACLFVVRWLQRRGRYDAILAGGALGTLLLLRTQSLLLVPIVLGLAVVASGIRRGGLTGQLGLFALGLLAAIIPWLLHNFLQSGQITFDAPFEYQVVASQYQYTGNLDLGAIDLRGKSIFGILLAFAVKDPGFVAWFLATHFLATLIDSVLALPLAARYDGLLAPLNLYWMQWSGHPDAINVAVLLIYLVVIAVGVGAAWRRLRWAGLAPLAFALGYALANGVGRFSGWRYDLPADWVAYFYFAIGVAGILHALALVFKPDLAASGDAATAEAPRSFQWRRAALLLAAFGFVSALPWLMEGIAAPRYAAQTLSNLMERLTTSKAVQALPAESSMLESFTADPQATLQIGRVLYPRFFTRDDGLASAHPWPAYAPRDFPRTGFILLNQSRHDAVMPMRQPESGISQGSDAIILGCQRQDYIEVRLILFPDTDSAYLSAPLSQGCK